MSRASRQRIVAPKGAAVHDTTGQTAGRGRPRRGVAQALRAAGAQAKLRVGAVDDPAEREADRMAHDVLARLAAPDASIADRSDDATARPSRINRSTHDVGAATEDSRVSAAGGPAGPAVEQEISRARGGGTALPTALGAEMSRAFGADLGGVRLHHGDRSDALNRSLNARAFTLGSDIFFARSEYRPSSSGGRQLLAHELAHVVQQSAGPARRTIRRLPDWNWVTQQVGNPKTGKNWKGRQNSKDYIAFGDALQAYEAVANVVIAADFGGRTAQYLAIRTALDRVRDAVAKYNKTHKTDARARTVTGIGSQCNLEKAVLSTRKNFFDANPPQPGQTWSSVLPESMGTHLYDLDADGAAGGQQAGGINTVTQYALPGGFSGFNKFAEDEVRAGTPEEGITQDLYIPARSPAMDKRALASWRVDQLLNANILTRTERTINERNGNRKGIVSEAVANGEKFGSIANRPGEYYNTTADKQADAAATPNAFTGDDPVFQRCLSKLTIVDALCGQVDRHPGNFFVQTDGAGNVLGVVGIDNDLAFPEKAGPALNQRGGAQKTWEDITKAYREYPGVGLYFDWETAEMVLALDPADLAAVVADLLPASAVAVLLGRLTSLKAAIAQAKIAGHLLTPAQWGAAVNPKGAGAQPETGGYLKDNVK